MKKTLPIFVMVIVPLVATFSQAQQATPASQPQSRLAEESTIASTQGQAVARKAVAAVEAQRSLYLQMRQRINMFGQQLVGNGVYQQLGQGDERRLRLDLKVKIANQSTSMQQVCDSRFLYIRRDFGDNKSLGRVDLRRIREEVNRNSNAGGGLNASQQWMMLGGLPQLLARLEKNFQFAAPREAMLENTPVTVIDGVWKPQALLALLPDQEQSGAQGEVLTAKSLSRQLPTQVRLVVRRNDGFPLRIEYLRSGKATSPDTPPPLTNIMAMEFYDIRTGVDIDPLRFVYNPGDEEVADHTELYLKSMGLSEPRQATREKQLPR